MSTKRYVVDRSNYTFSELLKQKESVGMVFDNIEATFELDPCTNYLVTPLPAFCTGCDPAVYEIVNLGPIST